MTEPSAPDPPPPEVELAGPELPPIVQQAKNFAKAAGRVVRAAAKGKKVKVPKGVYDSRVAICRRCPLLNHSKMRCAHPKCGCFIKPKAWLATETCPEAFWAAPEKLADTQRLRKRLLTTNVLQLDDILKHRGAVMEYFAEDSRLAKILREYDKVGIKKRGCCGGGRGMAKIQTAFIRSFRELPVEAKRKVRGILGYREYIMAKSNPLTWDQLMETSDDV